MIPAWLQRSGMAILKSIARIGADPQDDDHIVLQKTLLVGISLMTLVAAVLWSSIYYLFREPAAAAIPFVYAIFSLLTIIYLGLTRRYEIFRFIELLLILLLPWLLMMVLGGFVNSSAVILWSLLCPIGALLFDRTGAALRWFLAFIVILVLSALIPPFRQANNLPRGLVTTFFVMNIGVLSIMIFALLTYFVNKRDQLQARSDQLLLNVLPREIAEVLKNENRVIADEFEGASILFADVVDFTPLSSKMSANELVELLNDVFSQFDVLVEKHGLEKIKTIGDCYMVAAGVPIARPDHAHALVTFGLEMKDLVERQTFRGRDLRFRIGINSGSVVAGVIGRKKFIYDLWGDAVNTASRMESHGVGGEIQITESTYQLIKDAFICTPQGTITVKGKGAMPVWHVLAPA